MAVVQQEEKASWKKSKMTQIFLLFPILRHPQTLYKLGLKGMPETRTYSKQLCA
jgi:hypothetical protein